MTDYRTVNYWVKKLSLKSHPEGGYYSEIYRSGETIFKEHLPERYSGNRCFCTSIYYLIVGGKVSKFHKIKSDEIWHFYDGETIEIHIIDEIGNYKKIKLGRNPENNEQFQAVIKRNSWFGAIVVNDKDYSLIGCTVVPGFDFEDFELADRNKLLKKYPDKREIIEILT